jgi:hypothetical protein
MVHGVSAEGSVSFGIIGYGSVRWIDKAGLVRDRRRFRN